MIDKKQGKRNLKETRKYLTQEICNLRISKGLSVEEFSNITGITIKHILEYEKEKALKINIGLINTIARACDKKIRITFID